MTELQKKSLNTIELNKILDMLANEAVSQKAKEMACELEPSPSLYECNRLLEQVDAAVRLMGAYGRPYFAGISDIYDTVRRAEMGGLLNHRELIHVAQLLSCARGCKKYMENNKIGDTCLDGYFTRLQGNRFLEDKINNAIISEEEMSDNASSELFDIRRTMRRHANKVKDVLNKIITSSAYSKMLQENIVTIRSDRYVVPIKSEYKGSFPGLVHDMSSSGATLFIEPLSVVEINNEIKTLASAEKKEMERILYELSADVAQFGASIMDDYQILCELDFIFAKGSLAYKMYANRPRMIEKGETKIINAKHPLLDRKTAVPVTITIGGEHDTVIITGPNTGGKTVSIKTLGLLTAMAQCGLFIPAAEGSVIAIAKSIYADIGDEQSIEQSLSTFSSHMRTIVNILEEADSDSLVLTDELGAGTDPVEGAALAIAIIEYLRALGARVIATTHYAELKIYALETPGVENASCEFDVATLKPTYKLLFGIPGKSNAFAISEKLGLPVHIVEQAKLKINSQNQKFEEVITRLEEKRQALEGNIERAEKARAEAEEKSFKAQARLQGIEAERERLLAGAKREAHEILLRARRTAEESFDELKKLRKQIESSAPANNISEVRAAMRGKFNEEEGKLSTEVIRKKAEKPDRPIVKGDNVKVVTSGIKGVVVSDPKDGKIMLQVGAMKVTARLDEVELTTEKAPQQKLVSSVQVPRATATGKTELDLRGKTADEAMAELSVFMDTAIRAKIPYVTIIHGKGTGVLRSVVHQELKNMKHIRSFRLGTFGEGEAGVTIVNIV
ncbi:MAG: endonuclease MutS2 [Clostridia bacterium]|nr:endonuclease MutS2 [Clostridia bacterium]